MFLPGHAALVNEMVRQNREIDEDQLVDDIVNIFLTHPDCGRSLAKDTESLKAAVKNKLGRYRAMVLKRS